MGGKSSPKAPDYTQLAAASERAAELGAQLGQQQLDFSRQQYDELKPVLMGIVGSQLGLQEQSRRQGDDYYNYLVGTYRPLEQKIAQDAMSFNTEAHRETLAQQAAADSGKAFDVMRKANERAMLSMGVNPNSGRFAGINRAGELQAAAHRAGAMNQTRVQAEALGNARMLEAAGLGRNLPGASAGAYQMAIGAGNAAGQNAMAPGNQYMAGMQAGAGTWQQGIGQQMSGLGNIMNMQGSIYGMDMNNRNAMWGGIGNIVGMGLGGWLSDRRLKENIVMVGRYTNGLPMYEFSYRSDGTGKRYLGVMADDVEQIRPEAVSTDELGFKRVDYGMLGIDMREVAR